MFRRFSVFFLILSSVAVPAQDAVPSDPHTPKIFHDPSLGVTYSYPGAFTPVTITPVPAGGAATDKAEPECVHSRLSAGSAAGTGNSVFVLSSIDNSCPGV